MVLDVGELWLFIGLARPDARILPLYAEHGSKLKREGIQFLGCGVERVLGVRVFGQLYIT